MAVKRTSSRSLLRRALATLVALCLVAASSLALIACSSGTSASNPTERSTATAKQAQASASASTETFYQFKPKQAREIPADDVAETFSLDSAAPAPAINLLDRAELAKTAAAISEHGTCSYVFLDLQSGWGISHNAGAEVYAASASKAVVACWALLQERDANRALSDYDKDSIAAAIRSSSNEAFEAFGYRYLTQDYLDWLKEHGVSYNSGENGLYMWASARGMTALWGEIARYLESDAADAAWFAELLGNTNRSFIRDAMGKTKATVLNKAGWIGTERMQSTSDAALISLNGRNYLMVILTAQPDSADAAERVTKLAKLLFAQRDLLQR